jgi:GNAT superfamily N-acetyltransferase
MVRQVAVSGLVDQWASTSNSNSVRSQSIQMAAQDVFNLDDAAQWNGSTRALRAEVESRYEKHGETYREFVKAQYDETQAMFKSMGVTEIDVYRGEGGNNLRASGVVIPSGGVADVQTSMRPLSSWASEIQVAQKFAKGDKAVILKATVPVSRVVSTPHSGNGCLNEHEIVLFGGTLSAKAANAATVRVVENGVVSTVKPDVQGIFKAIAVVRVDRDDASADWVKTLSWDLPQTVEGMEAFLGSDWREIMEPLPAWLAAPDSLKKITLLKHGTHDQSDHGRRGSGSPAGRALDPTNADDVREAFTGTIETRAGTVNVVVDSVDVFDFSTTVQGALIGPEGEYVGRWSRTVTPEIKVMYNESFEVAEGSRKSGIGTEFQKHSEQAALALGMEKIVIRAAMDGKEAWASERFGFDFAGPPSEGLYRAEQLAGPKGLNRPEALKQVKEWQSRFDGPESGWPKPHEILAAQGDPVFRLFTDRPEQVLGSFVLGYGWEGKKPADRVTKRVEPKMFYVTVESDYAGSGAVAKHGIHDQSSHGNWAHGKGTGSHAGEAKMGPASATDGYGNARTTAYISGNRGETQTPLPEGWFRATEQEHDDYDRAAMRAMMRPEMLEGIDKGSPLEDDYLRAYRSVAASKVQLFAGPNGTGVVVQGEISWRDDFTPEDFVQNLKQLSELQRVTPAPGLQVIVGTQEFSKHSFDESTRGFVDTRDVDTMHLRPSALSAGNKYDVEGSRRWDNLMSTSEANRPVYALTHEYGHVVDRRSNESALADFNEVVQSNRGLITGSSPYAREGYFGEGAGGRGLQVGDKPTGREMYAEAWTGWVLSKGWAARNPGMVQFFAEKYGWDSETGTAPMAKAKVKGRIYMDSFGPEGGWVLDSLPGEGATVAFAPGLKPVLKHGSHAQLSHGNRSKGIDRTEMPQIPKANREAFLAELTDSGISHREEAVDPRDLRRTQRAIDPVNVAQMHAAMVAGTMKEGLPIIVSSDGKVLDGHHRWAAAAQLAGEVPGTTVKITRVDMKMDDLLARARKFNEEQGIAARAIGEVRPVAKHGQHDQSSHGRKAGSQSTEPVPVTPESVAKAFDGTYTTDSGLEFTLASRSSTGAGGGSVTVEGEIIVGDAVVGHWVRKVSGTTMYAESLNVGKDFDGNSLPGAEQFQGKGIALEVQKQTEKAARELGCTEIRVSAMSDGVAAWAQERFGYRFEEKPSLRATSKAGREPRDDAERAVPLGGVGYPNGSREYRGEDGLMYGFSHPDLGVPAVRNALAKVEQRFKSDDRDDWPSPSEVVSLGTGRRVDDDIIEGRTLGEFLLSRGWSGVKSADHVTKAVGGVVRVVVEGVERPVAKHGSHDQRSHGRRYSSAVSGGLTASIADRVREYGGLSVNIFDGSEPETGFMVARGHGKGAIVTAEEFYDPEKGPEILTDFLIKYRSDLTGGAYLGLWHNKKDGNVYLDVSDQIAEQGQAEKLGGPKFRDQISIWDVAAGEEIQTGGSGKLKKGVRDGGTGFAGRGVAESLHGYGRGDQVLRERVVGQVRGSVSIGFTPGLVPVLKHGTTHNEADHGRRRGSSSAEIARSEASGEVDYMMREGRWLDEQLSRDGMAMPPPPGVLDYIAKAADKVEEWVDRRLNPPLESLPKAEITQIVMANRARVDASRAARGLPPTQWPEWDGGSVEKADADVVDILRRLFAGEVDDRLFQLMKRDERPLVERDGPFADLLDVMLNAVGRVAGDEAVTKHEQHNQKDHGRRSGNGGEDPKAMSPELQAAFDHATGIFTTPGPEAVALANLEAVAINHAVSLGMSADDVPYRDLTEVGLYGKAVIRRAYDKRDQDERFAERSDADNEALATVMDDWRFGGDVMVKVPSDVLDDIIADRVKNQFDTDTSRGLYDPDVRAVAETAAHGLHPAAPASERPIYGFVGMPGSEHPYALDQYGDVTLVLKPSVKDKTTITLGDSLNQNATPIPMNGTASIRELSDAAGRNPFVDHGAIVAIGGRDQLEYGETFMEAQIFGGIRLEQISRIVFREGDANPDGVAMLREELEGSGVSVEII